MDVTLESKRKLSNISEGDDFLDFVSNNEADDDSSKITERSPDGRFIRVTYKQSNELIGKKPHKLVYKGIDTEVGR